MGEQESFYDREIAPALLEIARKCEERGLSIVTKVEWEPGETGTTASLQVNAGFGMRLAHWGAAVNGNVDSLVIACKKYGMEHGHQSICLHLLGVPYDRPALAPSGTQETK